MNFTHERELHRPLLRRTMLCVALTLDFHISAVHAETVAINTVSEICLSAATYPMIDGGVTVFSHDRTCFTRPTTQAYPWEKKMQRTKRSALDPFSGQRIVRYDYHDALYHCAKRHMRLPTIEELKALYVYANSGSGLPTTARYAIVAPRNDPRYPGGLYGWGGGSAYWTHTFAGGRSRKVIDLSNGKVSIYYSSRLAYVSCVD